MRPMRRSSSDSPSPSATSRPGSWTRFPLVKAWSDALLAEELVTGSVVAHFEDEFAKSLTRRGFYVAQFLDAGTQAAE